MTSFVAPDTPIGLDNCDREPIHIPGAIQPHGVLLAVRETDGVVAQASANAPAQLNAGAPVVGCRLDELLGESAARILIESLVAGDVRSSTTVSTTHGVFDAAIHRSGGLAVIELEAASDAAMLRPAVFRDIIRETLTHIEQARTLPGVAGEIADQMRRLTGFDRVWVYRFHDDWHGEIIGESRRAGIEPWLGLHYPASDIPAQARALFLKNWVRIIPDVAYTRVPLEPIDNPLTGEPLDLGNSVLRAVSPIHIEYLSNMGVTASLVISLIHRGKLWGLISGHHYAGPKIVSIGARTLCEFLAQALSLQLGMAETVEDHDRILETRRIEHALRARLGEIEGYQRALTAFSPTMADLTRATGAAVCDGEDCVCVGQTPTSDQLRELVRWLRARDADVFQTEALATHYVQAAAWTSVASGLLAVSLSPKRPHYLLWFRPERTQTIHWAGDPSAAKIVTLDGVPRLSPRGSFAAWEEERRGTAAPWDASEIEAATDLRRTLLDLLLKRAEEVATMNAELQAANQQLSDTAIELETQAEELTQQRAERELLLDRERAARTEAERANRSKADFLAVMSHELRTPLNAIGGYAQMLEMGVRGAVNDDQVTDLRRIQTSQRHLLGLINNILNFAKVEAGQVSLDMVSFDLDESLGDIEMLVLPQLGAKQLSFELRRSPDALTIHADPEKVRQILVNLLSNAIKFTPSGGRIELSARLDGPAAVVDVADTGQGIPVNRLDAIFEPFVQVNRDNRAGGQDGIGLGLAISRELARQMGGELTVASTLGAGSKFTLTLPVA